VRNRVLPQKNLQLQLFPTLIYEYEMPILLENVTLNYLFIHFVIIIICIIMES